MKTYATWKRETAYRLVRGQARMIARKAKAATLVLTDGDQKQADAAYSNTLRVVTRQLLDRRGA